MGGVSMEKRMPVVWHLVIAVLSAAVMVALLTLTAKLEPGQPMDYLAPYKRYIMVGELVVLGMVAIEQASLFIRDFYQKRISADVGNLLRLVVRVAGYAVIISTVVSLFTANTAAALTLGGFMGLVAGFATQTVIGNAVAGVFLSLARPFHLGQRITVGANSGTVHDIGLMHTTLDAEDRYILIPSSTIVTSVIFRHKGDDSSQG